MGERDRLPDGLRRGVRHTLELHLADLPETLAALRLEMARLLRQAALDEPPVVASFAERVAAAFEAGQEEE